jgi:L,D-transpeptidase catalytic domain
MRRSRILKKQMRRVLDLMLWATVAVLPGCAAAQSIGAGSPVNNEGPQLAPAVDSATVLAGAAKEPPEVKFRSRRDSLTWVTARKKAERADGFRIVISLFDRTLWVLSGSDTLREATVAVAKGTELKLGEKSWNFETPRGTRTILRKDSLPVWVPPEWHYVEVAQEHNLKLVHMPQRAPVKLSDGNKLVVRDSSVGVLFPDGVYAPLPMDEEIVFDSTLFIPPVGTKNRRVEGELGRYRLDMGNGYLLHGTPHEETIGTAATHGCIRLKGEDIEWLFENVPVGTKVYIY